MSLVITVSKSAFRKLDLDTENGRSMFEKVTESTEHFLFVPMPGMLTDILRLLTENNVSYHVSNSDHELSLSRQINV